MMRRVRSLTLLVVMPFVATASAQSTNPSAPPLTRPRVVATATPTPQQQPTAPVAATPTPVRTTPQAPTPVATQLPTSPGVVSPAQVSAQPVMPPVSATLPPPVALKPLPPLPFSKVRTKIAEAQRLLKTRPVPTAYTTSLLRSVTLAALDPDSSQVHLVTLAKSTFLMKDMEVPLTTSLGTPVRLRVLRPNYVNTAVVIFDSTGRQFAPLVVEYPIEKGNIVRETAYYTSAHPVLLSPDLVKTGQTYVRSMLDAAVKRLQVKGKFILPQIVDIAERLCIVEHIDHDRFRRENRIALYEEVYALYALNELDTYRYSVSSAGAGGMVQMIPATYYSLRYRHPGVGLNPDFVLGMRNHGNALEAMLLYMQDTWTTLMQDPDVTSALATGLATQPELMAAGYNSNPTRLGLYIYRGGSAWRTLIPRETQMYLQIYKSFDSLVPLKPRG